MDSQDKIKQVETIIGNATKDIQNYNVEEYERLDSDEGYITNRAEICLLQANHITDVVYNRMLGQYDEYGNYEISEAISVELTNLPKKTIRKDITGTYARATVGKKTFEFCITPYERKANGDAYCYLQLLEPIEYTNGYIINTQTTTIATYEFHYTPGFNESAKVAFNVDQDDTGNDGAKKITDSHEISKRIVYLDEMAIVSTDLYERLDEAYFNKRLQILNRLPCAAVVIAEFNKERDKIDSYFVENSARKYKALNDLLTSIIEGPAGDAIVDDSEYQEEMTEVNEKYLATVVQIDENAKNSPEVKALEDNETKEEGKENGPQVDGSKLKPNVKTGDAMKAKKAGKGPKGKKPYVPKPDKRVMPKPNKKKGKDQKKFIAPLEYYKKESDDDAIDYSLAKTIVEKVEVVNHKPTPKPEPKREENKVISDRKGYELYPDNQAAEDVGLVMTE